MQKTFTQGTVPVLVIVLLALVALLATYNSNIAVGVAYRNKSSSTPILAG